jgi:hypothetical protein
LKRCLALAALLLLACDNGGDVDHRGRYGFLPGQGPVSTAPLPLSRLLVVESDAGAERTRFYWFEGDLGAAGIGVDDLRRLAVGFNRFDMSFATPVENPPPAGEGGGANEPEVPVETRTLELDDENVELHSLTSDELARVGAARFAGALEGSDFRIRAFFGALPGAASFHRVAIDTFEHTRQLSPLELEATLVESALAVSYGDPSGLDYIELGLFQPVVRSEDQQPLEAGVITRMWPGTVYSPSFELLSNVFEQACWSLESPLTIRVTQYSQVYSERAEGDVAFLERQSDQLELAPLDWNPAIGDARSVDYCGALEPVRP